jgi:pimeloyl-ACP methyl ester carboxylesterase
MQESWVSADGVPLFVRSAGSGSTIICLHGFPESGASWARQMSSLGTTHRVVAPDGRGHGRSGCPSELTEYRIQRLVADVLAVADHFGAGRFALVGHDWGGIVAWCAAAWHPDRISHLVTLNAPHPTLLQAGLDGNPDQQAASSYIAALTAPDVEEMLTPARLWELIFASDEARGSHRPGRESRAARVMEPPRSDCGMLNWYRAAPFDFQAVGGRGAGRLPAPLLVDVPTLVTWGMDDPILLPALLQGLDDLVPDLAVQKVHGAGHGIVRERPELVTQLIEDYLSTR